MRISILVSMVVPLVAACMPPSASRAPAVVASPLSSPASADARLSSVEIEAPRLVLGDLLLRQEDVREGMRQVQSPGVRDPQYDGIYECLGGPGGNESGFGGWADPDGREALWRLSDLRWTFDSEAAAEAFRRKTMKHFEGKSFAVTPCETPLGDDCARVSIDAETRDGPHREIGFLFRVGPIVAEVEGAEGPRVSTERLADELVLPFARRAEERIRAAMRAR